jgi:hypothetical protein
MVSSSNPEVERGNEIGRLCDDVSELVGRQLLVVVDVGLKQNLKEKY